MRFFSFFALACACTLFHSASAAPVPKFTDDLAARDDPHFSRSNDLEDLEARAKHWQNRPAQKYKPTPPPTVTIGKGSSPHAAHRNLNNLNLYGNKRKQVVNYHTNVVNNHMKTVPGAHSAVIKNLAHNVGTRDPKMHISAVIKAKNGKIIEAPRRGNPSIMDPTHHIYVNPKTLPKPFVRAQQKKANRNAGAVGSRRTAQKAKQAQQANKPATKKKQSGRKPGRR